MSYIYSESVHLSSSKDPVTIGRKGNQIYVSSPWNREYEIITGMCEKCQHPYQIGKSCSTCIIWDNIEYVRVVGAYIPKKRQTAGQNISLTDDLWNAKGDPMLAELLGCVLGVFVRHQYPKLLTSQIVTAVPAKTPPSHADYMAEAFCRVTGNKDLRNDLLVREGDTKLWRLGWEDRWKTANEEFQVSNQLAINGESVLIIDDILTNGATLERCASLLKKSGASKVFGAVLGRTI